MKQQVRVFYSGRVQGVGFRFTVRDIADKLGIVGSVKNLGDGRVEVVAEAQEGLLKDFLSQITHYFSRYIQDADTYWLPAANSFKKFSIEF